MKQLNLGSNLIWSVGGMGVFTISQWIVLICIAKIIGAHAVGQYALGTAISVPVFAFLSFQLKTYIATDKINEFKFGIYFSQRLLTIPISLIIIIIVSIIFIDDYITTYVVIGVSLSKGVEAISDIFYGIYQKNNRMDIFAKSLISRGIVGLIFFSITIIYTKNIFYSCISLSIGWLLVVLLYDIPVSKNYEKIQFSFGSPILLLCKKTFALALVLLVSSLSNNATRYLIQAFLEETYLGIYAIYYYFVTIMAIVAGSMGSAMSSTFATKIHSSREQYLRVLNKSVLLFIAGSCLLSVVIFLLRVPIVETLYSNDFLGYDFLLVTTLIGGILFSASGILDFGLIACRLMAYRIYIVIFTGLLGIAFGIILFPLYGINAAGVVFLISSFFSFTVNLYINLVKSKKLNIVSEEIR